MEEWILDTNIFINAAHQYYGMDFCPGFWQWLLQNTDCICSMDMVKSDDGVQECYGKVAEYIDSLPDKLYNQNKKDVFLDGADPMLIAHAMAHGMVLVTNEKFNAAAHKKIYLPNVANQFDVKCTDIFDVMRQLKAKLVLE